MSRRSDANPHFQPQHPDRQVQPQRPDRQVQPQRPDRQVQSPHGDKLPQQQQQQQQQDQHLPPPHPEPVHGPPRRGATLQVRSSKTTTFTWFIAAFCVIFWVVIILGGLIVLVIYLVYRPKSPKFDVSGVTLNAAYLDMGYLLNADVTLLANFTNPNKKVSVDFSYMVLDLYYGSTLIASRYVDPFSAASSESKFADVHMVISQVRLPLKETKMLQKQIESNRVILVIKGYFRTRSHLGFLRYSYWLYGHCSVIVTGPPSGVLVKKKCTTKH